jgi:hypothetical protein
VRSPLKRGARALAAQEGPRGSGQAAQRLSGQSLNDNREILDSSRSLGVRIGTGYSSLSVLKHLPIDRLGERKGSPPGASFPTTFQYRQHHPGGARGRR